MAKYETLREVRDAMEAGTLDREKWWLLVTDDAIGLRYVGPKPEGMDIFSKDADRWQREKDAEHRFDFEGDLRELIPEMLKLAGIESEWV